MNELEVDRAASSSTAGVSATAVRVAAARADAGALVGRGARMRDAGREPHTLDGGVRTAAPDFAADAGVGDDAGRSVAGRGSFAEGSRPSAAGSPGSSGSSGAGPSGAGSSGAGASGAGASGGMASGRMTSGGMAPGGMGEDASVEIEVGADRRLGNTDLRVSDILGYYSGNWGQMILRKQGEEIVGVYEHHDGTLIGEINDEGVFVGWWTQLPTRTGTDAGELEFRWLKAADGVAIALDGRWRYGIDGDWLDNWDVVRVSDRSAPSQLTDRFERADDFKRRP